MLGTNRSGGNPTVPSSGSDGRTAPQAKELTAAQVRLQHMISMQNRQQASLRRHLSGEAATDDDVVQGGRGGVEAGDEPVKLNGVRGGGDNGKQGNLQLAPVNQKRHNPSNSIVDQAKAAQDASMRALLVGNHADDGNTAGTEMAQDNNIHYHGYAQKGEASSAPTPLPPPSTIATVKREATLKSEESNLTSPSESGTNTPLTTSLRRGPIFPAAKATQQQLQQRRQESLDEVGPVPLQPGYVYPGQNDAGMSMPQTNASVSDSGGPPPSQDQLNAPIPYYGTYQSGAEPGLQQQMQQLMQQQMQEDHGRHQFHYGGPGDYLQTYSDDGRRHPDADAAHPSGPYHKGRSGRRGLSSPLACLKRCTQNLVWRVIDAENLHRSLCFGAIDGMLTGSGIAAACAGLGLVDPDESTLRAKLLVLALTLAACASDGVCMAVGHIWSTRLLAGAALEEKKEERANFDTNRADAKTRLVDGLLSRGMLKIDAMSVADTLEGYPDIFVGALVGGDAGLQALGMHDQQQRGQQHGSGARLQLAGLGGSGGGSQGSFGGVSDGHYAGYAAVTGGAQDQYVRSIGGMGRVPVAQSYGQFDELRDDPDSRQLHDTMADSRNEGLVMMVSFCIFSVLPTVIYVFLPSVMTLLFGADNVRTDGDDGATTAVSNTSISISITSFVMLLLGMWKSHFFESSWIMFGVETVLVFLLCVATAYSIGFGFTFLLDKVD